MTIVELIVAATIFYFIGMTLYYLVGFIGFGLYSLVKVIKVNKANTRE